MPQEGRQEGLILIDAELAVGEAATGMRQHLWKALGFGVQWRGLVEENSKSDERGNWYSTFSHCYSSPGTTVVYSQGSIH